LDIVENSEKMYKLVCSARFDKIDNILNEHGRSINQMSEKVNNGFDLKIDNLKNDIENIKEIMNTNEIKNAEDHRSLRKELKGNRKLLWTLLITILSGLFGLIAVYISSYGI